MSQSYPFYDLTRFTWLTNIVSIFPGALCVAGLVHGFWSWQELSALGGGTALESLTVGMREQLQIDTLIREAQVITTLVLVLFYTYWVYFSSRNMMSLFEEHTRSTKPVSYTHLRAHET